MKLTLSNRRGQEAFSWTFFGMMIAVSIVSFVVLAIMLGALQGTTTANSAEYNITGDGLTFLANLTGQMGTAGTILGVSLLLVIIAGVGFAGYGAYQKTR